MNGIPQLGGSLTSPDICTYHDTADRLTRVTGVSPEALDKASADLVAQKTAQYLFTPQRGDKSKIQAWGPFRHLATRGKDEMMNQVKEHVQDFYDKRNWYKLIGPDASSKFVQKLTKVDWRYGTRPRKEKNQDTSSCA